MAGYTGTFTQDPQHLVTVYAGIDPMPVLSSYLGVFLAGAMFLATAQRHRVNSLACAK